MIRKELLLLGIVLISLAGCIGTPSQADISAKGMGEACTIGGWWGQWQGLGVLLMLISAFILAIVYMFGNFFNSVAVIGWTKNELFQMVATVWLFAIAVGLVGIMCTIDPGILGLNNVAGKNLFDASIALLESLRGMTISAWWYLLATNIFVSIFTTAGYGFGGGGIGYSTTPFAGFAPVSSFISFLVTSTVIATITSEVQIIMMKFVQLSMMNIIFPIGLFLRCFEPTRRFGGSLMGLAIGMFVFYPLLTTITYTVVDKIGTDAFQQVYNAAVCRGPTGSDASNECCSGTCQGIVPSTTGTGVQGTCTQCLASSSSVDDPSQCCKGAVPDSSNPGKFICNVCGLGGDECRTDADCCSRLTGSCGNIDPATGVGRCGICKMPPDPNPNSFIALALKSLSGITSLVESFTGTVMPIYTNVLALIPIIFVGAFFMPALNFILLIGIVQNLSGFFGDEIDITNLTRLI